MYWWEGYYGISYVVHRLRHRRRPFVQNFGDQISPFIVSSLARKLSNIEPKLKSYWRLARYFFASRMTIWFGAQDFFDLSI
jgi:hypothetical protein